MLRPWWSDALVYQLYVRSFADANGDGKGDLQGIRQHLPHLRDLGIEAIWLNPCYPSPQWDHGYDVADYFAIEPDYGDLAVFSALVDDARDHGIKVLMDVVPNHCSWDHVWFKEALAAGPGSAARERFSFRDGKGDRGDQPPNNWRSIFGGSAWHRITEADGTPGQWYLGIFTPQQPDFNWEHPDVPEMFDRMLTFWFDRGVEGFRADAVTVVGKTPGFPDSAIAERGPEIAGLNEHYTYRPEGHVAWRRWRGLVDRYNATHDRDVFIVAEAYTPRRADLMRQYVNDTEFHQSFAFDLLLSPWHAPMLRDAVRFASENLVPFGLSPAWTLNNHDAQRSVTRYGRRNATDPASYTGTNLLNSSEPVDIALGTRRAAAALVLMLALPGSSYLYMGEELGLPEVLDLPDEARQDPIFVQTEGREIGRDGCRVPMPWTADAGSNYGFSTGWGSGSGSPAAPWLPQPADWGAYSAARQAADEDSMLLLYRRAAVVRRERVQHASHELDELFADDPELVAFERGGVLVVLNTADHDRPLDAAVVDSRSVVLSSVRGHVDPSVVPANATIWLAS